LLNRLPAKQELAAFNKLITSRREIPEKLRSVLELIPSGANPMDVMRTISSVLGLLEPEGKKNTQFDISIRLIAVFGPALLYWYHFSRSGIRIKYPYFKNIKGRNKRR